MDTYMTDARFPIGKFEFPQLVTAEMRDQWLHEIAAAPSEIRSAVASLNSNELESTYRPGGWTARQVVHHVADSHMNSYVRFRLALTEDDPLIKSYHEDRWAELPDARTAPVELSLTLLDTLHQRWSILLHSMGPEDFQRTFRHPEFGPMTLEKNLALYAWHGKHHTGHILLCATMSAGAHS
jgi:uncharacterized damage-inducible protein DinB